MAHRATGPVVQHYAVLARVYDRLVGDPWFPKIRRSFEWAVRRYRIRFRSAADIGCGTGTFVQYLARRGIPVFGVDRSAEMLAVAAAKNAPGTARFLQQDVRALQLPSPVDLITCNLDTLNYLLSSADLEAAFSRCCANLNPHGHFVFDMMVRPRSRERGRAILRPLASPGISTQWTARWSAPKGLSVVRMQFSLTGPAGVEGTRTEVHLQRWHALSRLPGLLRAAGFKVLGVRDMDRLRPPTPDTSWVKVVGRKGTTP